MSDEESGLTDFQLSLLDALNKRDCRTSIWQALTKWRDFEPTPAESEAKYDQCDLHERIRKDKWAILFVRCLNDVFETRVFKKIPPPHFLTVEDLERIAFEQLSGCSDEEFSLDRLISHVANCVDHPCVGERTIELGIWNPPVRESGKAESDRCQLELTNIWQSNGFFLRVDFTPCTNDQQEGDGPRITDSSELFLDVDEETWFAIPFPEHSLVPFAVKAHGHLISFASPLAHRRVESQLSEVVPSIVKTLAIVTGNPPFCGFRAYEGRGRAYITPPNYPNVEDLTNIAGKKFISDCLKLYFSLPVKKSSTLPQRLRNAIHLLAEADKQEHDAIALSLCFSAVEAIVCDSTAGIVEELATRVAAMLEPDRMARQQAIENVKGLYDIRSKTLHGSSFEEVGEAAMKARHLAAAVVAATLLWQTHYERIGAEPNRKDLLKELRANVLSGGSTVGITEELRRYLP